MINLYALPWPKLATHYSSVSGTFYRQERDDIYCWNASAWNSVKMSSEDLLRFHTRPTPAQFNARYKDELIHQVSVAIDTPSGATSFPFGQKGITDRFNMVRAAMAEYDERIRILTGLPRFYAGQKVHVKPSENMKRGHKGWVDGVSEIGGYCAATGRKVESGERLYYIRLKETAKVRPFLYTFCEEVLEAVMEPMPTPPKIVAVPS